MNGVAESADEAAPGALCVAVLGAESTGKTTLASGLALALGQSGDTGPTWATTSPSRFAPMPGLRTAWVPEVLRQWCDENGRTPQAHEQAAILQAQHTRIDAAAGSHDVVICDTTGLMTAVYSELIFGDRSLHALAVALHRRIHISLLTALDLPWVADGHQRDGPQVREPVDRAIRALLLQHRLPFAVIGGSGPARLQQGLAALQPLLRQRAARRAAESAAESAVSTAVPALSGLFTRLQTDAAAAGTWACECCGDAPYERALRRNVQP